MIPKLASYNGNVVLLLCVWAYIHTGRETAEREGGRRERERERERGRERERIG